MIAALGGAAWLDWRRREVPLIYWYAALRAALPLGVYCYVQAAGEGLLAPVVVGNLLAVVVAAASFAAGLMGGADLLAVALVAAGAPTAGSPGFPSAILTLLYAAALSLPSALWLCVQSLTRRHLAGRVFPKCFVAVPMRVGELRGREWWYPLGSNYVSMDPDEAVALAALERGEEGVVWATPGIPFLLHMLLGSILAYTLAEAPLRALLGGG